MLRLRLIISAAFLFLIACVSAQQVDETVLQKNLKHHISTLASDEFEGRETGTHGEKLSYQYIISQYKEVGLEPKGTDGYLQPFPFDKGKIPGKNNMLSLNGKKYKPETDFFVVPSMMNGKTEGTVVNVGYGICAPALDVDDYKNRNDLQGKIFLMEASTPDGNTPHGKFGEWSDLQTKVDTAVSRGAVAVIFINTKKDIDDPKIDYKKKQNRETIPAVFAKGMAVKTLLDGANVKAEINVELKKDEATGHNIIGFINYNAATTIVIGAHYDHLGYGDDGSLYRGAPAIHNGADDNASGNAALIELARYFKNAGDKSNNYLFIAFSGEEKGLLGSNYFVKNPIIPLEKINYMINMDMVGRLKTDEPTLQIHGVGTSPEWKNVVNSLDTSKFKIRTTESGVGPSDHTSFYLSDIPVLHFFSGTHDDYHKPGDDEDKINYNGEAAIIKTIITVIDKLNDKGKLAFTKTNDSNNDDRPKFKVTLGVIPDYAFEGEGMRIDGVSDGKPAAKAGLLKGDIVIQIGEVKVSDMMSYMKALGKFTKGETTNVKIKRGSEEKEMPVTF